VSTHVEASESRSDVVTGAVKVPEPALVAIAATVGIIALR
jgi:hypothetical protein